MDLPAAAWDVCAVDPYPPLFAVLTRSDFMPARVVSLVVSNRLLLETRRLRTSCSLVAAVSRLSRYPSILLIVPKEVIALSDRSVVGAAVPVPVPVL